MLKDNQWKKYGQKITKKTNNGIGQISLRCYYKCNFPVRATLMSCASCDMKAISLPWDISIG